MKANNTKRMLLSAVMALVLCVSLLVGTTFAWFTDSVTSQNNKIVAGTLQMDLELLENGSWTSIKNSGKAIFDYDKWEPGYTAVQVLRVTNKGTLALKWYAKFVSQNELSALADVIDVYVNTSATALPSDRSLDGYTKVGTVREFVNTIETTTNGALEAGATAYLGIGLKMQETAGNEYQGLDLGGAFDIQILATQFTSESDTFDDQYDKNSGWAGGISQPEQDENGVFQIGTPEELAWFANYVNGTLPTAYTVAADGHNAVLTADIDLNNIPWTPIGRTITAEEKAAGHHAFDFQFSGVPGAYALFDGQGHTVYNLNVNETANAGLFGAAVYAEIKGVTVDGATVSSNHFAGVILAQGYAKVEDCHVKNATVTCTTELVDGAWDNGDKVGGVVGKISEANNVGPYGVINCSAENVTVSAYRDAAGILGYAGAYATVSGNTVNNVKVIQDNTHDYKAFDTLKQYNVNAIVGDSTRAKGVVVENNEGKAVLARKIYGVELIPAETANQGGTITVKNAEDLLTLNKLGKDWVTLFTDGNGAEFSNYSEKAFYYHWAWTVELTADIDLQNVPVESVSVTYWGDFNGNGHTVSNAVVKDGGDGLLVQNSSAIRNLIVKNVTVNAPVAETVGAVSGNAGTLENVHVVNAVVTGKKYVGGIVGKSASVINCSVNGATVTAENKTVGGLVGYSIGDPNPASVRGNTVENVTVVGAYNVGGLLGQSQNETVENNTVKNAVLVSLSELPADASDTEVRTGDTVARLVNATIGTNTAENVKVADVVVETTDDLIAAAKTANATVYVKAGVYETVSLSNGVTLIGEEGTVIKQAENAQAALGSTKNTTIKNVTFEGTNAQRWGYASGTVVFENCTFKGQGTDSLSWAIHYDGTSGADIVYKNCDIYGWVAIGGGANSLVFDGCRFYGNGAFGLCRSYSDFTVQNCTFDYSDVDNSGTRSVGIEALSGATVTVINCTNVNGDIEEIISRKYEGTKYEGNYIVK